MGLQEDTDSCCMVFPYNNHKLLKSVLVLKEDVDNLEKSENESHYCVHCNSCDTYMRYVTGFSDNFGMWTCPCCGSKVRETTVYNHSQRELERSMARVFNPAVSEKYHEFMDSIKEYYKETRKKRRR